MYRKRYTSQIEDKQPLPHIDLWLVHRADIGVDLVRVAHLVLDDPVKTLPEW